MINSNTKILILFFLISSIFSCNSQQTPQAKSPKSSPAKTSFGKPVSKIDQQIWQVFQDKKGNYWFGSNGNGLYHFDGNILLQITRDDGLLSNTIRDIQADEKGNIYIGTPEGVSKFDGTYFTTLQVSYSSNNWRLDPTDLWFNCNGNHLYRCDGEVLHELYLPDVELISAGMSTVGVNFSEMNNSDYAVYGIDKDREGNLWLGTITAGAFRYDGESFLWFGEKELSTLPDGRVPGVRSILEDKDGYFWLSNFYSKYRIAPDLPKGYEKLKAVDLPEDLVGDKILYFNSGLRDDEGNLWMTTYGGGVWKYDGKQLFNFPIHNGVEDVLLVSIYQDNEGTVWLGTNNDGVYRQEGDGFVKFDTRE